MADKIRFSIAKGNINSIPSQMKNDKVYVGISSDNDGVSKIIIDGKEWTSKEYVDNLESEVLRNELVTAASLNDLNNRKQDVIDDLDEIREGVGRIGELDDKQDILVSGVNIKSINGETLLDEGDIETATKEDIETIYGIIEDNELVTAASLNDLNNRVNNIDNVIDSIEETTTKNTSDIEELQNMSFKTINGKSIVGEGDIEVKGVTDYNELKNKPFGWEMIEVVHPTVEGEVVEIPMVKLNEEAAGIDFIDTSLIGFSETSEKLSEILDKKADKSELLLIETRLSDDELTIAAALNNLDARVVENSDDIVFVKDGVTQVNKQIEVYAKTLIKLNDDLTLLKDQIDAMEKSFGNISSILDGLIEKS